MVIVSPLRIGLWDPFQLAFLWLANGGDPNHLLTGMILQVWRPYNDVTANDQHWNSAHWTHWDI